RSIVLRRVSTYLGGWRRRLRIRHASAILLDRSVASGWCHISGRSIGRVGGSIVLRRVSTYVGGRRRRLRIRHASAILLNRPVVADGRHIARSITRSV